ncbi:unnamed protein product [Alopecurus aequalis]
MSTLRFFGSLVVRICGRSLDPRGFSIALCRTFADGVGGFGFPAARLPMGGESHGSVVAMGTFSFLMGAMLYFKEDEVERTAHKPIREEDWEEDSVEEKVMKNRFEEWMIKYGRTYEDKEEKAMRYKLFKRSAEQVDWHNATRGIGCTTETNHFSDRTSEELELSCGGCRCGVVPEEELIKHGVHE